MHNWRKKYAILENLVMFSPQDLLAWKIKKHENGVVDVIGVSKVNIKRIILNRENPCTARREYIVFRRVSK